VVIIELEPGTEANADDIAEEHAGEDEGEADEDAPEGAAAPKQEEDAGGQGEEDGVDATAGLLDEQLALGEVDDIAAERMHDAEEIEHAAAPLDGDAAEGDHEARIEFQGRGDKGADEDERGEDGPQGRPAAGGPGEAGHADQGRQPGEPGGPHEEAQGQEPKGTAEEEGGEKPRAGNRRPGQFLKTAVGEDDGTTEGHGEKLIIGPLPEVGEKLEDERGKAEDQKGRDEPVTAGPDGRGWRADRGQWYGIGMLRVQRWGDSTTKA